MSKRFRYKNEELDILQSFVETINKEIDVDKSYRYESDYELKTIYVGNKRKIKGADYFEEWATKTFGFTINHNLIAILHEIGHLMTNTEQDLEERTVQEELFQYLKENQFITEKQHQFAYFEIKAEYDATKWGYEYYKNHKDLCEYLIQELHLM